MTEAGERVVDISGANGGVQGLDVEAREFYERNRKAFTESYATEEPERIISNVRRGADFLTESRAMWVGDKCFWYGELVDRLPGARVLEIGCGTGASSLMMAQLGAAQVTSLEINDTTKPMLEHMASTMGFADRIEVRIGDVLTMDLEPGSYDLVVCQSVLHHVVTSQEDEFIARTAELLAPSGMTRISDPSVNSKTLDAIRWAIPTAWRPSSFQKEKFAAWRAQDEHPVRDNSTNHVAALLTKHYGRVDSMTAGVTARLHRAIPSDELRSKVLPRLNRLDSTLPETVRRPLACFHGLSAYEPIRPA
jgi:2-polyprenyl-3-methyl-5-hydroxy-6-metoxy-1,4-benzoquinol methylase